MQAIERSGRGHAPAFTGFLAALAAAVVVSGGLGYWVRGVAHSPETTTVSAPAQQAVPAAPVRVDPPGGQGGDHFDGKGAGSGGAGGTISPPKAALEYY
jgi:hypothetical protein